MVELNTERLAVLPVSGVRVATVASGIRYRTRDDLVLIEIMQGGTTAALFTRNAFCAAPVVLSKKHLTITQPRYLLINAGNANAGLGEIGIQDATLCCKELATLAGVETQQVLTFSTGVIGKRLPTDKIVNALPILLEGLSVDRWQEAATAIMTTDTVAKWYSTSLELAKTQVTLTGIAKGAGMICPNMATMLAYIVTDIKINQTILQQLLERACQSSFNSITVDGDTSTNDACVLIASGASGLDWGALDTSEQNKFFSALLKTMENLAKMIIGDAEGATRFIKIEVSQASSYQEARNVAYTIAHSPLVKTACSAGDPNWGRIVAAVGRSVAEPLDINRISCYIGDCRFFYNGALDTDYDEVAAREIMAQPQIVLRIMLGRGEDSAFLWTSDLTEEYVRINADYRS